MCPTYYMGYTHTGSFHVKNLSVTRFFAKSAILPFLIVCNLCGRCSNSFKPISIPPFSFQGIIYPYILSSLYVRVCTQAQVPTELEVVVRHTTWVLGAEPGSSARLVCILICGAIYSTLSL